MPMKELATAFPHPVSQAKLILEEYNKKDSYNNRNLIF